MKFAKELDENAVPEWKGQYLDYKGAKKKLKAVERAYRGVDRSSSSNLLQTPFTNSLRDAPVFSFLNRKQSTDERTPIEPPLRLTRSRSEASAANGKDVENRSSPIPINERSPLRSKEEISGPDGQPMRRYGSIIGTPPENELTPVQTRQKPVSLLELPNAALEPEQPKHLQRREMPEDPDYDRPISPGSPAGPSGLTKTSDAALSRNNTELSIPKGKPSPLAAPGLRKLFRQPQRTNSMPGDSRPFVKRMFSTAGIPPKNDPQDGIALEAYREVDFRQEEFFHYLDKQLNKVENFYEMKEEAATERLKALREQLHVLRDRRWEEIVAQQVHQREVSHKNVKQEEGPQHADRRLSSRVIMAPVNNAVTHIDNAWDKMRGSYVGQTSRKMEELASPVIPSRTNRPPDQQDYVRRPHSAEVPYRSAKRKLKTALAEFYRSLELLKSYALLNRTGFRKINKKYDKTVNAHPTLRYMEKVNKAHFVSSDVLDAHIHATEDLYARYFERGNHKLAITKLRSKIARAEDYTGSIWRQGVLVAAGSVFAVEGLVYGVLDLYSEDTYVFERASYLLQLYAGYFFMVLLSGLFVVDARIFERNRVNYQFIFEFNRPLNWRQLSEVPAYFYFLLGLVMWLNFKQFGGDDMYIYWPTILIGLSAILLLFPPPLFYFRSRKWFLYSNWRLLLAGVYPVEFRDFFLGDMFCSLTYSLGNIEMFFCLYAHGWNDPQICNSSNSRLLGFFTALPGIFRALQCLRRFYDTRNVFPHLVNCGKYTFTILYYMTLSLYRIQRDDEYRALFILFASLNAIYCSIWDIFMDWSLLDFESKNYLLRNTLAYKRKSYYYLAIPFDVILRFNWIFYAIFAYDAGHASIVSFCVALSEIFRRAVWVIFRVENEHCTNVARSRASRDVPLPYVIHPSSEDLLDKSPEAQEARRQGTMLDRDPSHESEGLSQRSTHTSGADVEQGTPGSMRRRGTISADSPVMRTLRRVGSTMLTAHAQDYERKRKPEAGADAVDSDDDASSDSDNDRKNRRTRHETRRKRDPEQQSRLEATEELPEPSAVSPGDLRDRMDTATAEEIIDLARPRR